MKFGLQDSSPSRKDQFKKEIIKKHTFETAIFRGTNWFPDVTKAFMVCWLRLASGWSSAMHARVEQLVNSCIAPPFRNFEAAMSSPRPPLLMAAA